MCALPEWRAAHWTLVAAALGVCCLRAAAGTCLELDEAYARTNGGRPRALLVYGREREVEVVHDESGPSAAAAALYAAAARALRYGRVRLTRAASACALAARLQRDCDRVDDSDHVYDHVVVSPSAAWSGERCPALERCAARPIAPPRLTVLGGGAAPAALQLHAVLPRRAPAACLRADHWHFYTHGPHLRECLFIEHGNESFAATVWYSTDMPGVNTVIAELSERLILVSLHMRFVPLESAGALRRRVSAVEATAALFLDYALWDEAPGVLRMEPPPALGEAALRDIDPTRSLRMADERVLEQLAPPLLEMLLRFTPTPTHLREVLETTTARSDSDVQEAACAWAIDNREVFDSWLEIGPAQTYGIVIFLCSDDPYNGDYKSIGVMVENHYESWLGFRVAIDYKEVDCASEGDLTNELIRLTSSRKWRTLVGAVVAGAGVTRATPFAARMEAALVARDAQSTVRGAGPALPQLAAATAHFVTMHKWKRLAVLSDKSIVASQYLEALKRSDELVIRNIFLENESSIRAALEKLRSADARIFYVNTAPNISREILCITSALGMTSESGYVWILREWYPGDLKCRNSSTSLKNIIHFTVSSWWHKNYSTHSNGPDDSSSGDEFLREKFIDLWRNRPAPPLGVPLADALLLLIVAFNTFSKKYPERIYDMHGLGTVRLLTRSFEERNHHGMVEELQYRRGRLVDPVLFADRWTGGERRLVARLQVTDDGVRTLDRRDDIFDGNPPRDRFSKCLIQSSSDEFQIFCGDSVCLAAALCMVGVGAALAGWRRARLRGLRRHDSLLRAQLLASQATGALEPLLVARGALQLRHELRGGRQGAVRAGLLRPPGARALPVAAKRLPHSELRREAGTLAALRHDHVVRLVGVCVADGPLLLLLTAYAFFGNLQDYLLERRHLASDASDEPDARDEAARVSAEELTRMGREAAAALEYLALRRVVHRDVRARNCLVDEHRSLKLAGFELARETEAGSGASGEMDEYWCRRRGLFPVPWMAPESLQCGVFSAASDAWSLGVLLLELLTLGARPYGDWPPQRVLHYVCDGGCPPLPADVSPDAERLMAECWRRAADARLTAAEVARRLAARPEMLRPALAPLRDDCRAAESRPLLADCCDDKFDRE